VNAVHWTGHVDCGHTFSPFISALPPNIVSNLTFWLRTNAAKKA